MLVKKMKFIQVSFVTLDLGLTIATFGAAMIIRNGQWISSSLFSRAYWLFLATVLFLWPVSILLFDVYGFSHHSQRSNRFSLISILPKLGGAVGVAFLFCVALLYMMKDEEISRLFLMTFIVINIPTLVMGNFAFKMFLRKWLKRTSFYHRILLAGRQDEVDELLHYLKVNNELFIEVVGIVELDGYENSRNKRVLGHFCDLPELIREHNIDDVVVTVPYEHQKEVEPYIQACEKMGITVHMVMDVYKTQIARTQASTIGVIPALTFSSVEFNPWQVVAKRMIDIVGSLVGLLITGVLSVVIVPAMMIDSPGRVFFRQKRMGKNGRTFEIVKFRTMFQDAEQRKKELMSRNEMSDFMFKMKDDPRVTRVGRFLRRTSLDEFPQFWNVLLGEMSLVGTRPPTPDEVEKYDLHHWRRLSVKPGISGYWQVSGRNQITDFEEVVRLDVLYIDRWSIWLDFSIIFKTFRAIVQRSGR